MKAAAWLVRDIPFKVTAILVALVLWFFATNDVNPVIQADLQAIPVSFTELGTGLIQVDARPTWVTVAVRGRREVVEGLSRRDVSAWVSLSHLVPGEIGAAAVQVAVPPGIQVTSIRPESIAVMIDRVARRQIPVEVVTDGALDRDYALGQITTKPTDVLVEGPTSLLDAVHRVRAVLDVQGLTADIVRSVPTQALTEDGDAVDGVTMVPHTVEVTANIVRLPPVRTLPISWELVGEVAEGYGVVGVTVEPERVRVRGPEARLAALATVSAGTVDVSGASADVIVEQRLIVPEGCSVVDSLKVTLKARIEPIVRQTFTGIPVRVVNVEQGLRASVTGQTVTVEVSGVQSLVTGLRAADVAVEVDAQELASGVHMVEPRALLGAGLTAVVEPALVELIVQHEDDDEE